MKISRRTFIKSGLAGAALVVCSGFSPEWLKKLSAAPGYQTTIARTVIPVPVPATSPKLQPTEISKYAQYGYGLWQEGVGLTLQKRLDLMPASYTGMKVTKTARLLNFFTITDIHITDKESPTQAIYLGLKHGVCSAYSGVMLYSTHVLDAAVQAINDIHKQNPIDFGLSLGDTCNNTQYNETRWYIDIFDGKTITPSSGAHLGADTIEYQKPFKAVGLDKSIPWYQTLGNHDHFWMGTNPVSEYIKQAYVAEDIMKMGDIFMPGGINRRDYYMGVLDCRTPYGDVIGAGPVETTNPPKIAADPNRRSLSRKEWMQEFFTTSSQPAGHGFSQANIDNDFASYSFEPKSDIPVKVIVLDDTQKDEDPDLHGYGHGTLDKERYEWLVNELDHGQAEGKLMIIAAHVPIGVEGAESFIGWWSNAYVAEQQLIAKLQQYPNFILWVAGHRHYNTVTPFASPDSERPELGFWQIETASLRDFPQQFRTTEIVRNSDNTISIVTVNVDTAAKAGSLAAKSRSCAIADRQIYTDGKALSASPGLAALLPSGSYNAELVIQVSPEMQAKLQKAGTPINK